MAQQKPTQNAFACAARVGGGVFYAISGMALFFAAASA